MKPLTCKEVSRLISEGQDRSLDTGEQARLRLHFVACETCRAVKQQMDFLRRAIRDLGNNADR